MAYLLKGDLTPPMYAEIIDTITREDESIIGLCIDSGIAEAKSYLVRFNLLALFGDAETETEPSVTDEHLKSKVKDLVCWQLIKLANPNIDLKLFRTNYEDAITWLNMVKKSELAPEGWLYKDDDADTPFPEGDIVSCSTNTKRNNHW